MSTTPDGSETGETTAVGTETTSELGYDEAFGLLKNGRRRAVLSALADTPETTLSELAERIAAEENDTEPTLLTSAQRKRVYISLYQNHLPKLADEGVIDYDRSRGDVVRRPPADRLIAFLDGLEGRDTDPALADGLRRRHLLGGLAATIALAGTTLAPATAPAWTAVTSGSLLAMCCVERVDWTRVDHTLSDARLPLAVTVAVTRLSTLWRR
ncbi:hypothetical protein [Halobaculum sp. MBLA0143]|uniref:DUF7344 domain-containing protein n=1 Tax=Halobaculum sp. MBLA0143 TaxID=3079933 RepID=UPI0035254BD8